MARVSVLTFHYSNNVAAMLQAYGLVKALENEGHTVEVIDYRPLSVRNACEGHLPRHPRKRFRTMLFRWRIRGFRGAFLPLSRTYLTMEELKQDPPNADYVVCGSDQVWNIHSPVRGFDATFFLDFLPDRGPRRISYAASFGDGYDLGRNQEPICALLSRFDHISVREIEGQNLVRKLIDRSAIHVLDPSFLTDYNPITPRPIISQPYILTYCFRKTSLAVDAVQHLRQKLNLPVVSIKTSFDKSRLVYPGPLQWLSLMHHASFVCTDSYHGTCFSLKNGTQFMTFPYVGGNSRLEDVLRTVGLEDRFVDNDNKLKTALQSSVNYTVVSPRIESARKESFMFLREALR